MWWLLRVVLPPGLFSWISGSPKTLNLHRGPHCHAIVFKQWGGWEHSHILLGVGRTPQVQENIPGVSHPLSCCHASPFLFTSILDHCNNILNRVFQNGDCTILLHGARVKSIFDGCKSRTLWLAWIFVLSEIPATLRNPYFWLRICINTQHNPRRNPKPFLKDIFYNFNNRIFPKRRALESPWDPSYQIVKSLIMGSVFSINMKGTFCIFNSTRGT